MAQRKRRGVAAQAYHGGDAAAAMANIALSSTRHSARAMAAGAWQQAHGIGIAAASCGWRQRISRGEEAI